MASNYKFPRVDVSSYARVKTTARPDTPDTTVLFMPIMSSIGPSNEVIRIHDMDEYVSYFNTPAANKMGISALALTYWLNAGGTLYAYRLVDKATTSPDLATYKLSLNTATTITPSVEEGEEVPDPTVTNVETTVLTFTAKYAGSVYNNAYIRLVPTAPQSNSYTMTVGLAGNASTTEVYNRVLPDQIHNILASASSIVADFDMDFSGISYVDSNNKLRAYTLRDLVGNGRTFQIKPTNTVAPVQLVGPTDAVEGGTQTIKYTLMEQNENFVEGTSSYYGLLKKAWDLSTDTEGAIKGELVNLFLNVNATPVDTLLDVGYPGDLKELLYDAVHYILAETNREDLFVAFSTYQLAERKQDDGTLCADGKIQKPTAYEYFGIKPNYDEKTGLRVAGSHGIPYTYDANGETESLEIVSSKLNGWFAVFEQWGLVKDTIYNSGADIYIPLSVMYAQNSAYNDRTYSMHRPTAGETYGVVNYYKLINDNPNARKKDQWFRARYNYMEQTCRSIEIMTNRTFYHNDNTGLQSALDFINNVRVKNKIVRDLRKILRKYLYEYADGDTLLKCLNECNAYLNGWINNKALASASVDLQIDSETEEYMYAKLYLKFRGNIEVIDVSIYLD